MPAGAEVPAIIRRYFHGVNAEDWDGFRGIWHEEAVVEVVGGMRFEGVEEILGYYPRVLARFPVHHDDPYAVHVVGDTVIVEIAFRGETAEGAPAAFEALDVFTLEDGRIRKLATWYDMGLVVDLLRRPGTPERRLLLLLHHAAGASRFYRRRLSELGLAPEQVAGDLTLLPPTRPGEVDAGELVAVPDEEVRQLVVPGDTLPQVPLAPDDLVELTRQWQQALVVAGVVPADIVSAELPAPGLEKAAAQAGVRLAVPGSAAAGDRGATVVFRAAGAGRDPIGARTVNVLAHPETGIVASGCPEGGLHVDPTAQVVEIVEGELVVTPLGRRALPLLRWVSGEVAEWGAEPCRCGSELPQLVLAGRPG